MTLRPVVLPGTAACTDSTARIAAQLVRDLPAVTMLRLAEKGRGRALQTAWGNSEAPVLAYMDVDLSTDLAGLLPLVAPLISGHSDLAIGTRLARSARPSARTLATRALPLAALRAQLGREPLKPPVTEVSSASPSASAQPTLG